MRFRAARYWLRCRGADRIESRLLLRGRRSWCAEMRCGSLDADGGQAGGYMNGISRRRKGALLGTSALLLVIAATPQALAQSCVTGPFTTTNPAVTFFHRL
jgi:hypothetical protein